MPVGGYTSRVRPTPPLIDGALDNAFRARYGRYGEAYSQVMMPVSKHLLADEGSYYVATNPTPGTGVAFAVNASSDFTKSLFLVKNNDGVGQVPAGKRLYVDYVKLLPTVAPASATSMQFAIQLDNINRYTSGATIVSGVNANMDDATQSVGQLHYATSAVITTVAASGAVRLVSRGVARSVIPAVLEEILMTFGGDGANGSSSGGAVGRSAVTCPPLVIGPGQVAVFNVWFPSNAITALSYEFEVGWWER